MKILRITKVNSHYIHDFMRILGVPFPINGDEDEIWTQLFRDETLGSLRPVSLINNGLIENLRELTRANLAYQSVHRIYGLRMMLWSKHLCRPVRRFVTGVMTLDVDSSPQKVYLPDLVGIRVLHWQRMRPCRRARCTGSNRVVLPVPRAW